MSPPRPPEDAELQLPGQARDPAPLLQRADSPIVRYAAGLGAALLLVILGVWGHAGVRNTLETLRVNELNTLLDTTAQGMELWIDERSAAARRWATEPRVRELVLQLARQEARPVEACRSAEARALMDLLRPYWEEAGRVPVHVIGRGRALLATPFRERCGQRVDAEWFNELLAGVFDGNTVFVRPYPERERLPALPEGETGAMVWIETPVRDDTGRVVAALGFGESATRRFASLPRVASLERTGEVFAFDPDGRLLSESRFAQRLVDAGMLEGGASAMRIRLRDPGARLVKGFPPAGQPADWSPTRLAHVALAAPGTARSGTLLDPYRSYHGGEVIGAWRWLPGLNIGLAVEIGAEEAFAALRYLNITFAVLFALLVLAVVGFLTSSFSVVRLRREVGAGRRLGPYRLLRQIGEGGMANVYEARHALLRRPTAVKVLKTQFSTDELIARFEREVQQASRLTHPNTIEIYDYGRTRGGVFYFAMEYLDGINLGELVERHGPVGPRRTAHVLVQVCNALHEAHQIGLVHRDIKPDNVMLCRRGGQWDVAKVLDFGIVKQLKGDASRDLTRNLRVLGTPAYMAPERIRSPSAVDGRADLYSVGAVAYWMLTGRRPYEAENDMDLSHQILHAPVPAVDAAALGVPGALAALVGRCMAKDPGDRPQDALGLSEELARTVATPWTQVEARAWWQHYQPEATASGAGDAA